MKIYAQILCNFVVIFNHYTTLIVCHCLLRNCNSKKPSSENVDFKQKNCNNGIIIVAM